MEKGRILLMFGMSIRKFIILSALIVSGCISHPETIAIDFDSGTEDYTPLVRKILAEHPAGEVTIRFGAGTFDFYPEQAAGSYLCVSNNDNGYKRCAFLLEEMRRVRIEGAGEKTQLRFHGAIVPFRVARCEQIVFEAFTIDCDASFIFEGLVVGNDPRTHSITLRISKRSGSRSGAGNPGLRATTGRVRSVKIFCSIPEPVRPTIRPNSTNTIKKKRCRPNGSAIRLSV